MRTSSELQIRGGKGSAGTRRQAAAHTPVGRGDNSSTISLETVWKEGDLVQTPRSCAQPSFSSLSQVEPLFCAAGCEDGDEIAVLEQILLTPLGAQREGKRRDETREGRNHFFTVDSTATLPQWPHRVSPRADCSRSSPCGAPALLICFSSPELLQAGHTVTRHNGSPSGFPLCEVLRIKGREWS